MVLRPARTPSASRGCACAAPHVVAACCTPTNFCTSFSLHDRAQQEPSAAPPALQALVYQSLQAAALSTLASVFKRRSALQAAALSTLASVFKQRSAVLPEQPQPRRRPVPSPPSWPRPAARAGGLQPLRPGARGGAGARPRGTAARGAGRPWKKQWVGSGRVAQGYVSPIPPLEPCVRLSPHTAHEIGTLWSLPFRQDSTEFTVYSLRVP